MIKMAKKLFTIDSINLLIAFIAFVGVFAFIINQPNYGLILLIISTLIDAITRVIK